MKKRFFAALFLIIIFSTFNDQHDLNFDFKFNIKEILIENNEILNEAEIKKQLSFIYEKNIFLINKNNIEKNLLKIKFIEGFEVKKIYPNIIRIKIFEKKPIAILQDKRKKYYYTKDNDIINYTGLKKFKNLPVVFSDKENFEIFYGNLKKIDFSFNQIKKLYFFESNRWDIVTFKDQTIKLPIKNYQESLKNFKNLRKQSNFDKYKSFDYRIKDQLILK